MRTQVYRGFRVSHRESPSSRFGGSSSAAVTPCWIVAEPCGPGRMFRSMDTWREAMDYATRDRGPR